MVVLNITFAIPCKLKRIFVEWLRTEWVPKATEVGMTAPRIARVMGGTDPEGLSLAFEMQAPRLAVAKTWFDGAECAKLQRKIKENWGNEVLFFATYLDIIDE